MKIPEPEILKTHCVMTVINGEIVYEAPEGQISSRDSARQSAPRAPLSMNLVAADVRRRKLSRGARKKNA